MYKLPFLDWVRFTGVGGADSVCIVSSTGRTTSCQYISMDINENICNSLAALFKNYLRKHV